MERRDVPSVSLSCLASTPEERRDGVAAQLERGMLRLAPMLTTLVSVATKERAAAINSPDSKTARAGDVIAISLENRSPSIPYGRQSAESPIPSMTRPKIEILDNRPDSVVE